MRSVLIRRFEISDQLTHLFNALFWAVLAATGIHIGSASRANVEPTHLSIGVHFAFGFALAVLLSAYILFVKSRFQRMLFEIFRTDRPFLAWFKCLGGYPSKILNRPQKSSSVPPQGRYNAGQRIAYGALIFLNILLLASGFALFALHQPQEVQSSAYRLALCVHSGAFGLACLLPAACYTYSDGVFVETALKAMLLFLGRVFLAKQEACRPWGKGRFGSGEKRRCYTNQAQSHDSERKTLEVIQQQNSLRRRLFLYPC